MIDTGREGMRSGRLATTAKMTKMSLMTAIVLRRKAMTIRIANITAMVMMGTTMSMSINMMIMMTVMTM